MPALRRLDTAAGACAKALPPFCAYMVAAHTAVRSIRPVSQGKHRETRKHRPAMHSGIYWEKGYEKDHSSFVYHCLRRCCCGNGSDRLRRRSLFHCGILCCRVHRFCCCCRDRCSAPCPAMWLTGGSTSMEERSSQPVTEGFAEVEPGVTESATSPPVPAQRQSTGANR